MEFEVQIAGDVRVAGLFVGQRNVEPGVDAGRLAGALVGRFHDSGTAAGTDDETGILALQVFRPFGQPPRQLARGLVIGGHFQIALGGGDVATLVLRGLQPLFRLVAGNEPGGTEKNHRVADLELLEAGLGLHVFGKDAQSPGVL